MDPFCLFGHFLSRYIFNRFAVDFDPNPVYRPVTCSFVVSTSTSTWASAPNYSRIINSSLHENKYLSINFSFANGFTFNGEKFVLVKCQEDALQAKSKGEGKNPLSVEKSNQCMTIARGVDGSNGGSLAIAVGKIADYLKANNY